MKIGSLSIRNYRTLESIDLAFPSPYAAICGPNDSGKTNIVRAIRALMKEEDPVAEFASQDELSIKRITRNGVIPNLPSAKSRLS